MTDRQKYHQWAEEAGWTLHHHPESEDTYWYEKPYRDGQTATVWPVSTGWCYEMSRPDGTPFHRERNTLTDALALFPKGGVE